MNVCVCVFECPIAGREHVDNNSDPETYHVESANPSATHIFETNAPNKKKHIIVSVSSVVCTLR